MSGTVHLRDAPAFAGRLEMRVFESALLKNNPLGDPHIREVPIYLPPGTGDEPLPVVFLLAGFTGRGQSMAETHPWKRGVLAEYDRAVAAGQAPPAILVAPDCLTRLGGSQYVNSTATGPYRDHVALELVDLVDEHYPTLPGRRAVVGKSSGGFGALHLAMHHPDRFSVAASISGDCAFDLSYAGSFPAALRGLLAHDSDPAKFLETFREKPNLSGDGHAIIDLLAMSACYSPNPDSSLGFDLPVTLDTCKRIDSVWERWLAFDPVQACEAHAEALRGLRLLHLECGRQDEFNLQFGMRRLAERLRSLEIPHTVEEFEGGHFDINHRYGLLLPRLIGALTG
jgi:enterochelin esterase family protein